MYETKFHTADLKNHAFLVTGGAGFIGSNIVEYLLRHGAGKVRVLDNLSTGFSANIEAHFGDPRFEFQQGDICNASSCTAAVKGIDFVLHQAALGSVPRSIANPLATHEVNLTGFLNMLTAAREARVKRFVYASSSSVYGDSQSSPKKESSIGMPLSPYAVTKYANELYAHVFALNYNMPIIGLRYFNIFGPRQNPKGQYAAAIPLFMEAVLKNASPNIFGSGEQSRDFTFVENAVQGNVKAAFTSEAACGKVYNIAAGKSFSVNELFNELKALADSSVMPAYQEERQGDVRNSLADISLAAKFLDYSPSVSFKDGLKITFDWFRQTYKA